MCVRLFVCRPPGCLLQWYSCFIYAAADIAYFMYWSWTILLRSLYLMSFRIAVYFSYFVVLFSVLPIFVSLLLRYMATEVATCSAEDFPEIVTPVALLWRELFTWKRHGVLVGVIEEFTLLTKLFTTCLRRREEASGLLGETLHM